MLIRRERDADNAAVRRLHTAAFERPDQPTGLVPEAGLVDALRAEGTVRERLTLVAVAGDTIVGHVMCSRGWLDPMEQPVLGLGPLGVRPESQRQGVGSALMHAVLAAADALDEPLVCLLGDPGYYSRFGFRRSTEVGIDPPNPAWAEHFQVRVLDTWTTESRGTFRYAAAFDKL